MDASYAFDWPVLPGTEPRPVTPIQWPSPPRVQLHATTQLTAPLPTQLPALQPEKVPAQLPAQLPAQSPAQFPAQLPAQSPAQLPTPPVLTVPKMSLPPEARYNSLEALYEAAQLHALPRGYAFTKRRSKKTNHAGRQKVYIDCDRHDYGNTIANQQRQRERNTNSRANGCPFSIIATSSSDLLSWELKHRPDAKYSVHNHPPSKHPSAHPAHRRLAREEQKTVKELAQAGKEYT
jgi:hypothetical protein